MFESEELNLWQNCESVLLETNFRQGKGQWLDMLNRFRIGEATEEDTKILKSRPSSLLSEAEYNEASHLQLLTSDYKWLLNRPYENEVTLRGQKLP